MSDGPPDWLSALDGDDPGERGEGVTDPGWVAPFGRDAFERWRTPVFGLALLVVATGWVVDATGRLGWDFRPLNWLFGASLLALAAYVVVPLLVDRRLVARYRRSLRGNRLAVASLVWVVGFFVVGTVGPLVVGTPSDNLAHGYQPPAFTSVHQLIAGECVGTVSGSHCHGTMQYPLGTNARGQDLLVVLVAGARVAVQVALVAATLAVPVGVGVGLLAGYRGGLVDDALMRYVDVQGAVPAFLVYLVVSSVYGRSLLLLVVAFGLLNWGRVARIVRGEVRQLREAEFVKATVAAGAGTRYTLRRSVLPNITDVVLTSVTREAATLVLIEAALAFMKLSELQAGSWGNAIAGGLNGLFFPKTWWISTVPTVALALTVVAFSALGDAMRDAFDPSA